jgi:hypothetical protein
MDGMLSGGSKRPGMRASQEMKSFDASRSCGSHALKTGDIDLMWCIVRSQVLY